MALSESVRGQSVTGTPCKAIWTTATDPSGRRNPTVSLGLPPQESVGDCHLSSLPAFLILCCGSPRRQTVDGNLPKHLPWGFMSWFLCPILWRGSSAVGGWLAGQVNRLSNICPLLKGFWALRSPWTHVARVLLFCQQLWLLFREIKRQQGQAGGGTWW